MVNDCIVVEHINYVVLPMKRITINILFHIRSMNLNIILHGHTVGIHIQTLFLSLIMLNRMRKNNQSRV